jgi:hypothetical protein
VNNLFVRVSGGRRAGTEADRWAIGPTGCCVVGLTHREVDQWSIVPVVYGGPELPWRGRGTHNGVSPDG